MDDLKLRNKIALITGGNSGIGLATARVLKAQGAAVIIIGQNRKTLEAARQELGDGTLSISANIARSEELGKAMPEVREKMGRVDVLFANAGISHCPPIEETDEQALIRSWGLI